MSKLEKHSCCIRFIVLLIPLFLVFVGMRVPDFSRPHKPKPMRRAVLDKTPVRTVLQSIVKIHIDPVIATPLIIVFAPAEEYSPEAPPIRSSVPLLALNPLPPRAPPAFYPNA